jgi:hypothetical protein
MTLQISRLLTPILHNLLPMHHTSWTAGTKVFDLPVIRFLLSFPDYWHCGAIKNCKPERECILCLTREYKDYESNKQLVRLVEA